MTDRRIGSAEDVELDMRALFRALGRALPWLVLLALVVAIGLYVVLSKVTPTYKAEAKVLIASGESSITRDANAQDAASLLDAEGIASQVQLIQSRDLADSVATSLDLANVPEFTKPSLYPPIAAFLAKLGLHRPDGSVQDLVRQRFSQKLDVYPVDKTRVITIDFSSADPVLAAKAANAVATQYLALDQEAKRSVDADATRWLESQIADLRTKVTDAEAKVETFRSSSNLFTGTGQASGTLSQQRLSDLNTELARLEAARSTAEANAAQVRAGLQSGASFDIPQVLDSQLIQRLLEQQVALRTQIAQLSATLLPQHPRLKELNAQLADLNQQVRSEANRILSSLEGEAANAQAREDEIRRSLVTAKADTAQSNDAEVQLRALQRDATAERTLLETYLQRYGEAMSRQVGNYLPADARIISRAGAPLDPSFPKKIPMTAAATMAILLLAIAIMLVRELMSGRVVRRIVVEPIPLPEPAPRIEPMREFERPPVLPVRQFVPAEPALLRGLAGDSLDSLNMIGDRLIETKAQRVLVSTVDTAGEARPLAAVALARSLSRRGQRVLVIDLQTDEADAKMMTALRGQSGFAELLADSASFSDVIFRDRRSHANIIPHGAGTIGSAQVESERFSIILDALDYTYDHILIDAAGSTAFDLARAAEAVILVAEAGTDEPRTAMAIDELKAAAKIDVLLLISEPPKVEPETAEANAA